MPRPGQLVLPAYLAASAVAFVALGAPTQRDWVWLWLLGALLVASRGDVRTWGRGVVRDWLPFIVALTAYDLTRAASDGLGVTPHWSGQVAVDRVLFLGQLPTVDLQRWLYDPRHLHVWDHAGWLVYTSHFVVTLVVAAVLWRRAHPVFRRFRAAVVTLAFLGVVTFAVLPTEPPWLAAQHGHIPPVARVTIVAARDLGQHQAAPLVERGVELSNLVAAVPSLHAAFPALILLFFWSAAGRRRRTLLLAYVLAMALIVVYAGEHYVADVLAGWAYAGAAVALVAALERRRAAAAARAESASG